MRGVGATSLGPVVTAVIQFAAVPVLLRVWGTSRYGDWLILSAVPSYLALTNMGFGDASASDMTMRLAAGDRNGAVETFQSCWWLLTLVSCVAFALVSALVWAVPWKGWLRLSSVSTREAARVILVLAAYVIVAQQNGLLESGYRCDGNFALGTICGSALRLIEAAVGMIAAVLGLGLSGVAVGYLVARAAGTIVYGALLRVKSPWLQFGFRHARRSRIKELASPAVGFMALPLGQAFSIQGFTIMIGSTLGPVAVTVFSTLRTLTRVNFQLLNVIAFAVWPELSTAFGSGSISTARDLHRRACQASLAASCFCGLLLLVAGPALYRFWVRSRLEFDSTCFHILLLVVVVNSLWYVSSVVPMSNNLHQRMAVSYLAASCASLVLARCLVRPLGIAGAADALLTIDLLMSWLVLRTSLRQVGDGLRPFLRSMLDVTPYLSLLRRVTEP